MMRSGHSKGTLAFKGLSKGTEGTLRDNQRALGHSITCDTQARDKHLGTGALRHLKDAGTWALKVELCNMMQ